MNTVKGLILAVGLVAGIAQGDVNTVPIGSAGNTNDVTGFGAVAYDYSIGTSEVTSGQFSDSGLGGSSGANTPIINVSWHEAAQFCNWLTTGTTSNGAYTITGGLVTDTMTRSEIFNAGGLYYVLPTLDEWYKAAYFDATGGTGYSLYADGTSNVPSAGTNVNYLGEIGAPWDVGSGIGYDEQNGTEDMMGNAYEWLETTDGNPVNRRVTGGSWASDLQSLKNVGSRPGIPATQTTNQLGFRVVAVPEPGTLSLMGLSTLGLFTTRSVRRRRLAGGSLLPLRRKRFCNEFCSLEEWEASFENEEDCILLSDLVREVVVSSVQVTWSTLHGRISTMNQACWNKMVDIHASRRRARKAFQKDFKKKAITCLDVCLSLIMK